MKESIKEKNPINALIKTISNLKRHLRVHTKEKPYKCTKCDKAFNTTSNLKQHEQIHLNHNERTIFSCDKCDKFYYYASNLKKHKLLHEQQLSQSQQSPIKEQDPDELSLISKPMDKINLPQSKNSLLSFQEPIQSQKSQQQQSQLPQQENSVSLFIENSVISSSLPDLIPNSIYSNYISIIHNGHIDFLINSYLYYYNGDDLLMHELEASPKYPFNEHECDPLEEITHWNTQNGYGDIMKLYHKMADELKDDGVTYAMLINKQNCNSIVCTCHCMKEHQNWQNCVNNAFVQNKSIHGQEQQKQSEQKKILGNNNNYVPIDMFLDVNNQPHQVLQQPQLQLPPQQLQKIIVSQQQQQQLPQLSQIPTPPTNNVNGLCLCNQTRKYKHKHGKNCGHLMITHAGHIDYIVGNTLHYPHGDHCDFHGYIEFYNPSQQQQLQQQQQQIYMPSLQMQQRSLSEVSYNSNQSDQVLKIKHQID